MNPIKILGVACLTMLFSLGLQAQNARLDPVFKQFQDDARFSRINVSSRMFDAFVDIEMDNPEEQEVIEALAKLKGLKALMGNSVNDAASIYQNFIQGPANNMEELTTVTESGIEFKFFVTKSGEQITELVMVGYEESTVMIMSLVGDIELEAIAAISEKMNIPGFENFQKVSQQ
ncbi:MAG: DUF4252 domain-containing protein [Bacteroidia bacterium]